VVSLKGLLSSPFVLFINDITVNITINGALTKLYANEFKPTDMSTNLQETVFDLFVWSQEWQLSASVSNLK